jgi:hypothetical protein
VITGVPFLPMLDVNVYDVSRDTDTCLYFLPVAASPVSTINFVKKMLHNLAPYPFRPPVVLIK